MFETPSLLFFKYEGSVRKFVFSIVQHKSFETYMMIIIILSSI